MNGNTGSCSRTESYSGTSPRALFAVSSLGLGHATRSLVLIHAFLAEGYRVTVISTGNALAFIIPLSNGRIGLIIRHWNVGPAGGSMPILPSICSILGDEFA